MRNYSALLPDKNVQAFLALIKFTEGANYNVLFGGGTFDSYIDHPRQKVTRKLGGRPITSSAAGAYQFLARTWDECVSALHLPDFSPRSQDLAALFLIDRRKALDAVIAGEWEQAIELCNKEWASLPGSPYGQPVKKMEVCLAYIDSRLVEEAPPVIAFVEQKPMNTSLVANIFNAFRAGAQVSNAATWKNAQLITNRLGMFGVALLGIARSFGYDFGLTDAQVISAAGLIVGAVFLFNDISTVVSSAKIGVFGVPKPAAEPGAGATPAQDADVFNTSRHG